MILHPDYLKELFDITIFVKTQSDLSFIRRLQRDVNERGRTVESVIAQYEKDVKPMCERFVRPYKRQADIVIENSEKAFSNEGLVRFDMEELIRLLNPTAQKPAVQQKLKLSPMPPVFTTTPPGASQQGSLQQSYKMTNMASLVIAGAISGLPADILAFPFCRLKTPLMTQGASKSGQQFTGMWSAAKYIYGTQGWAGFYRGMSPVVAAVIPGNALFFTGVGFTQQIFGNNFAANALNETRTQE